MPHLILGEGGTVDLRRGKKTKENKNLPKKKVKALDGREKKVKKGPEKSPRGKRARRHRQK